jgi:hypothetical protein
MADIIAVVRFQASVAYSFESKSRAVVGGRLFGIGDPEGYVIKTIIPAKGGFFPFIFIRGLVLNYWPELPLNILRINYFLIY